MKTPLVLALCLLFFDIAFSQSRIALENPSFEEYDDKTNMPLGWISLGNKNYSPPDIQPGEFRVIREAAHGYTYLGMVVRPDSSFECVGQDLYGQLKAGSSYLFSLWLAYSRTYISLDKNGVEVNYSSPTVLRIVGIDTKTGKSEILSQSPVLPNPEWAKYNFVLWPDSIDVNRIKFDAFFETPEHPYPGNLLLDNCSDLIALTDTSDFPLVGKPEMQSMFDKMPTSSPEEIFLKNPSFEKKDEYGLTLTWPTFKNTLFAEITLEPGTSIDESNLKPAEGKTYLSLMISTENTFQSVQQKLHQPLKKLKTYEFSLSVAQRSQFIFKGRWNRHLYNKNSDKLIVPPFSNFSAAQVKLEIWGHNTVTGSYEQLDETYWVVPSGWEKHTFIFTPITDDFDTIILKPSMDMSIKHGKATQGHVLIDNCSSIKLVKY